MTVRVPIPAAVKRQLRQRCGFGCVICGNPIYDYEHIDGYAATGNDPDRMTLLCPAHHREKTAGRLARSLVQEFDRDPFNGGRRFVSGHPLFFDPSRPLALDLGGLTFYSRDQGTKVGLTFGGLVAFGVGTSPDGHAVVEMDIRDSAERVILRAHAGQVRHITSAWDVTFEGQTLTIRKAAGEIAVEVQFDADANTVRIPNAHFWLKQVEARIGRASDHGSGIQLPKVAFIGVGGTFIGGGLRVGEPAPGYTDMLETSVLPGWVDRRRHDTR